MEVLGRVEPQVELLLSARANAAVAVNVRLKHPLLPLLMAQKLEVDLVVAFRVGFGIGHLQ